MATEIKKLIDLEYNEILTLGLIESDEDLNAIFTDEIKLPFNILRTLAKDDKLNDDTKFLLKGLFNQVILTKKEYINKYLLLAKNSDIEVRKETTSTPVIEKVEEITPPISIKKCKTIPRRYGKEKILEDIEKQGTKATPLQNAMLSVNRLKNIYVNLSARGIKDMFSGTKLLSDADCRDIVAVVQIAERKLEEILKRKK